MLGPQQPSVMGRNSFSLTSATNAALLTARDAPLVVEGMGVTSALVCINAFATYSSERAANLREVILTVKSWQIKHIRIVVSTQDEKALRWQIGDDVKWVEIYAVPDAELRAANGQARAHLAGPAVRRRRSAQAGSCARC